MAEEEDFTSLPLEDRLQHKVGHTVINMENRRAEIHPFDRAGRRGAQRTSSWLERCGVRAPRLVFLG